MDGGHDNRRVNAMSPAPRIISFCAHQPYLFQFKALGWQMDLVEISGHRRFLQNWSDSVRPLPAGWRLISWEAGQQGLAAGAYDLAIAHNISDFIDFLPYAVKRVIVMHTSLHSRFTEDQTDMTPEQYRLRFAELVVRGQGEMVFISEHKMVDWNLRGFLIKTYVDLDDYQGYTGERPALLRVANHLVERGEILDYPAYQALTEGFATTVLGENPSLPEARIAASWDDLRAAYRDHRVYVHTAKVGLEDGFNFAMLEAMATGMPVVSTAHPSSPIQDGVNGFISADIGYLRQRLQLLIERPELAIELGKMARRTVKALFPKHRFCDAWRAFLPAQTS